MKELRTVLVTVLLFLFNFLLFAQTGERFDRLTRGEGLSNNSVNSIIQDRFGFMWFATIDGLSRYDGFSFRNFYNEPLNSNSLLSNNISSICQTSDGYLWFGSTNGISKFDPKTMQFKHFAAAENIQNGLSDNRIQQIIEDKNGNLWIATSGGGLNYLNAKTNEFTKYEHNARISNTISSNEINDVEIDKDGNLWIATNTNLDYFDVKSKAFTHYTMGYESYDQTKRLSVNVLHLDKHNLLWIGTSDGLFTFKTNQKPFNRYMHALEGPSSISDDGISAIFEDSFGNIWIGTNKGLNKFVADKNVFQSFYLDVQNRYSLSSNKIVSLYEDRSNILWIGTKGGGVNKLDLKRKKFHNFQLLSGHKSVFSQYSINCISGDTSAILWIGTDGGGVHQIKHTLSNLEFVDQNKIQTSSLSDDQIVSSVTSGNRVWFGTQTGGLNLLELKNGKYAIKKYKKSNDSSGLANNQVNCMLLDKDGFLWVGTQDGLNKLIDTCFNGNVFFKKFKKDYTDPNSITGNDISALYQDHLGFIWIGTFSNGLNRLNPVTGKIDHYSSNSKNPSSLGSNSINAIFEDHFGILWFGTLGGGLNMLNNDFKTFTRFTANDGLESNDIMSVIEDHSGYLWLGTSKGLTKFDPVNKEFTNYDSSDGLLNDAFNRSSVYQDALGWLYFGTNSGLVYFMPSQIVQNQHKPDIVITKFSYLKNDEWFDESYFISKDYSGEKKIALPFDKNIFSLEFASMDFTNPSENQYQYKIEGLSKNWLNNGNKRVIMITNLEPGDYIIKIRGSNSDGVFNEEPLSLPITIKPPFWRTNSFIFIILTIIVFIVVSAYSFLIKLNTNKILSVKNQELELANQKLKDSERSLKELNETKDKFFSIIAHDLRNPFNPLLALTELLDNDYKNIDEAERVSFIKEIRHGAKKLYDLLENLLSWALSQTKQIKFKRVELDLIDTIENNIELLQINAEKKNISIVCQSKGETQVLADENMLNCIIRNLLNNAIKFSPEKTTIEINLYDEGAFYKIQVKDQGPGIPLENINTIFDGFSKSVINNAKGKGSGLGLILCKEFVEKNNGKIWVESELGKGCSFFFTVEKFQDQ